MSATNFPRKPRPTPKPGLKFCYGSMFSNGMSPWFFVNTFAESAACSTAALAACCVCAITFLICQYTVIICNSMKATVWMSYLPNALPVSLCRPSIISVNIESHAILGRKLPLQSIAGMLFHQSRLSASVRGNIFSTGQEVCCCHVFCCNWRL